jgi:hypothetical protein
MNLPDTMFLTKGFHFWRLEFKCVVTAQSAGRIIPKNGAQALRYRASCFVWDGNAPNVLGESIHTIEQIFDLFTNLVVCEVKNEPFIGTIHKQSFLDAILHHISPDLMVMIVSQEALHPFLCDTNILFSKEVKKLISSLSRRNVLELLT